METKEIKIIYTWTVPQTQEVDEVTEREENGQIVKVSRKVKKEVPIKFGLKKLTRREAREVELFYGKEFNRFVTMGFLPRNIMLNKHLDINGGVLSEKERAKVADLIKEHLELEAASVKAETEAERSEAQKKLFIVKNQLADYSIANESVFSQTAEAKAQSQQRLWLAFFLTHIERNGKWTPYFEGDGEDYNAAFKIREEYQWKLEEDDDPLYKDAVEKIAEYIDYFVRGVDTTEKFQVIEEGKKELEKEKKEAEIAAAEKAAKEEAEKKAKSEEKSEEDGGESPVSSPT